MRTLTITTQGYSVSFRERIQSEGYFTYYLDFASDSEIAPIAFMRTGSMSQADLADLANYLENHIAQLKLSPSTTSRLFVTYDGFFQLRALAGANWAEDDETKGFFTLSFLVDVGRKPDHHPAYIGGQSTIFLKDAEKLIVSLRNLARGLNDN